MADYARGVNDSSLFAENHLCPRCLQETPNLYAFLTYKEYAKKVWEHHRRCQARRMVDLQLPDYEVEE